jgi:hypothetical protein
MSESLSFKSLILSLNFPFFLFLSFFLSFYISLSFFLSFVHSFFLVILDQREECKEKKVSNNFSISLCHHQIMLFERRNDYECNDTEHNNT